MRAKILLEHTTGGKIADTSQTNPGTHTGTPRMCTVWKEGWKFHICGVPIGITKLCAYGEQHICLCVLLAKSLPSESFLFPPERT
jgi:hypothetical protein